LYSGLTPEEAARMGHLPEGRGLLGALMRAAHPIRLRNIADDSRSVGFCANHPKMTSFLGAPIKSKNHLLGTLYLANKIDADEFSAEDEKLVVMLTAHAAVAIENAQLYKQVQRLAVLEERERIGMDLHDGIIQSIYAVGLMLEYSHLLLDEDTVHAKERLTQAISSLNDVIKDIRNYILDLRPQRFQGKNLAAGLFELIRAFRANTFIQVEMQVESEGDLGLTPVQASGLFHIAQESLANIAKHSRASLVTIRLYRNEQKVWLSIKDNGRGYDPATVSKYEGHGLTNMEARARALGGKLTVASKLGQGTSVTVSIPLQESDERFGV
jgi:signal transduction histidine kinase